MTPTIRPETVTDYEAVHHVNRLVHFRKRLEPPPGETAVIPATAPRLELRHVPGLFAVCKLLTGSPIPAWATTGDLFCVTRTADELSVKHTDFPKAVAALRAAGHVIEQAEG